MARAVLRSLSTHGRQKTVHAIVLCAAPLQCIHFERQTVFCNVSGL